VLSSYSKEFIGGGAFAKHEKEKRLSVRLNSRSRAGGQKEWKLRNSNQPQGKGLEIRDEYSEKIPPFTERIKKDCSGKRR